MLRKTNTESHLLTELDEQVFTRSRTVVSRVVAGETLIVPVRGKVGDLASIYSFNGTGSLVWQLLEGSRTLAELASAVEGEYEVGHEQAQKDVTQFLDDMLSVGLVDVCPTAVMTTTEMLATEPTHQAAWTTAGSH